VIGRLLRGILNFISETLELSVLALLFFLLMYIFLVRPHYVNGTSMLPSFHNDDRLLIESLGYRILGKEPKRGDVIVFQAPPNPNVEYIKRIIALPGEKIKIQNGNVFIFNDAHPEGFILEESYLGEGISTDAELRQIIQEGEVFEIGSNYVVMGDNREASSDSRDWGTVTKEAIVGRAWFRYWPTTAIGLIKTPDYQD
jgi:signal peptidase I